MLIENWSTLRSVIGLNIINPQYFILREEEKAIHWGAKKAKGTIVDLGAGEHRYKDKLLKKGKRYIPVDLKHPVNKNIDGYVKADITKKLPFKNSFCETVCMFQVLEYLSNPESVFSETNRILKKGGYFILSSPFLYPVHDAPYDKVRYTKQALVRYLKEAHFKRVFVVPESSGFAFLANSINMFLLRGLYHRIQKGGLSLVIGYAIAPIIFTLSVFINCSALVCEVCFPSSSAEFPLNYTIVAQK